MSEFRRPLGVTADDDVPKKGYVRVTAVIPDLEVKTAMFSRAKTVKDGSVDHCSFKDQSFRIDILTPKDNFRIMYTKLPDKIVPCECKYQLEKGKVIIDLKKMEDRPWARELSCAGLEVDDPNET